MCDQVFNYKTILHPSLLVSGLEIAMLQSQLSNCYVDGWLRLATSTIALFNSYQTVHSPAYITVGVVISDYVCFLPSMVLII